MQIQTQLLKIDKNIERIIKRNIYLDTVKNKNARKDITKPINYDVETAAKIL